MTLDDLIDADEIAALERAYGPFPRQHHRLKMGAGQIEWWAEKTLHDRRGEVVLLIRRGSKLLLHTKEFYPPGIYRLLTGGVSWGEAVTDALRREVYEETGFAVQNERLLGLLSYEFQDQGRSVPFVSYIFLLPGGKGRPAVQDEIEDISDFKWAPISELPAVAASLRSVPEDSPGRRDWGRFRALAHEFAAPRLQGKE